MPLELQGGPIKGRLPLLRDMLVCVHSSIIHSFFTSLLSTSNVPGSVSTTQPYFYGMNEVNGIEPISQLWREGNERLQDLIYEEATEEKLKSSSWIPYSVLVWFGLEKYFPSQGTVAASLGHSGPCLGTF